MLYFGHFGVKKGAWSKVKGSKSKFDLLIAVSQFLDMFQLKNFGPTIFQFCGYKGQRSFFFNFEPLFQVWLLFWVPHSILESKYLSVPDVEFNSASIDSNLNKIGQGTKEIVCHSLLAPSGFLADYSRF